MGNINIIEGQNAVQKRYEPLNCIFRNFIKVFPIFDIFYKNLDYLDKKNKNKQNN